MSEFTVKDSGKRQDYESGMRRDVEDDKPDFTLAIDGPMFVRYADHLTKGAKKYGKRNWQLANSEEEMERFKRSAFRHMLQWLAGMMDEDHAAAVMFNINAAEYVKARLLDHGPGDLIVPSGIEDTSGIKVGKLSDQITDEVFEWHRRKL